MFYIVVEKWSFIRQEWFTQELGNTCSSKEPSLKDLQELAARTFSKGKMTPEQAENASPEVDNKKQPNKEFHSNANLSSLARFLLSR